MKAGPGRRPVRFDAGSKEFTGFGGREGCRTFFAPDLGGEADAEESFGMREESDDILEPTSADAASPFAVSLTVAVTALSVGICTAEFGTGAN